MPIAPQSPIGPWLPDQLRGLFGLGVRKDIDVPPPDDDDDEPDDADSETEDLRDEPIIWHVGSSMFAEWRIPSFTVTLFGLGGLGLSALLIATVLFIPGMWTWIPGGIGGALESAVRAAPRMVFIGGGCVFALVGLGLLIVAGVLRHQWRESVQIDRASAKLILRWRAGWFVLYEYRYLLDEVRELRLTKSADEEDDEADSWSLWSHVDAMWDSDGRLLFRYGPARIAFADGLSTRQAARVLDAIALAAPETIALPEPPHATEPAPSSADTIA